jgi:MOSC domain-containing protein YiiM
MDNAAAATVVAVSQSRSHSFSKKNQLSIRLLTGIGVDGDAHSGATVRHRSRLAINPALPNRRQVHLMHVELFDELRSQGFTVLPGQIGENITTRGIDLLSLPTATRLHIGATTIVEVTGLRSPCTQLDKFQPGLMQALLGRDASGALLRKSGIMGVVLADGEVYAGDGIGIELPAQPFRPLVCV